MLLGFEFLTRGDEGLEICKVEGGKSVRYCGLQWDHCRYNGSEVDGEGLARRLIKQECGCGRVMERKGGYEPVCNFW